MQQCTNRDESDPGIQNRVAYQVDWVLIPQRPEDAKGLSPGNTNEPDCNQTCPSCEGHKPSQDTAQATARQNKNPAHADRGF